MLYEPLDKELVTIRSIKNIEKIILTNILDSKNALLNSTSLGIVVITKEERYYHYNQAQRYFEDYLQHIIEQYQKEKNDHHIQITPELIPIFENQETLNEEEELSYYSKQKTFENQKIKYQKFKLDQIKNILFQELKNLNLLTKKQETLKELVGYRNRFALIYTKNNETTYYITHIEEKDDFNWHIWIENYFNPTNGIKLEISFRGNKTIISWESENHFLSANHEIEYKPDGSYETAILYQQETCIYIDKKKIEKKKLSTEEQQKIETILKLFHIKGNFNITKLPWNDYHLVEETKEELPYDQEEKCIRNIDIMIQDQNIYLLYNQKTKIKSYKTNYELPTSARRSYHHAIKYNPIEDYGITESKFYPVLSGRSKYKTSLENKYIYEQFKCDEYSLKDLKETIPEPIPNLEENDLGYQLLKKKEINKIKNRGEQS